MDYRVDVDFLSHPKTIHLLQKAGTDGLAWLLALWAYTTKFRPEGDLCGIDAERIETALRVAYESHPNRTDRVTILVECGWLNAAENGLRVSGWGEFQAWVIGSKARSLSAKKAAKSRWRNENKTNAQRKRAASKAHHADAMRSASQSHHAVVDAPSPTPSPTPNVEEAPPTETIEQKRMRLRVSFDAFTKANAAEFIAYWNTSYGHVGGEELLRDCTREIRDSIFADPNDPNWEKHHREGTWGKLIKNWNKNKIRSGEVR